SVNLMFEIDRDRDVQMTIFDVRGRVVRNLAEGRWAAGNHVLKWNGTDDGGQQVAAGVYFVRLESGSWVSDRKLVMVK
ncbi:MAG: serine protease, partial [Candidatus Krumholzibacteriia bacterium]